MAQISFSIGKVCGTTITIAATESRQGRTGKTRRRPIETRSERFSCLRRRVGNASRAADLRQCASRQLSEVHRSCCERRGKRSLRPTVEEERRRFSTSSELLAASRLNRFTLGVSQSFRVVAPGWEICMSAKRHEPLRRWNRETPSSHTFTTDFAEPPICSL
jgi:hypothetical protein